MPVKEMSTFDAAKELNVSVRTVQQWMEKGLLVGRKTPGGHRRISAEEVMALAELRRQGRPAEGLCKILVIEDDPDVCKLYELMSARWNLAVELRFAKDGPCGLIEFGAFAPDFTIVDLNIPLLDGYKLIDAVVSRDPSRLSRMCVVTGADADAISRGGSLPAQVPVIGKPIDFAKLEVLISNACKEQAPYQN